MTDDATLSTFTAGTDGDGRDETPRDDDADSTVETPSPTYAWGEYTCGDCGERTDRVWYRDGEPVCPSCTDWE